MFSHTLNGILMCYIAALPFLRNALCGDMLWMVTLFCLMRLALRNNLLQLSRHINIKRAAGIKKCCYSLASFPRHAFLAHVYLPLRRKESTGACLEELS